MIKIKPVSILDASVRIPGSKSHTNRALIIASLANGKSTLLNAALCDDTLYMIDGLRKLGVGIEQDGNNLTINGTGGNIKAESGELFLGNAGTAMRFLSSFAALADGRIVISGDDRMNQRPIQDLLDALSHMGGEIYSMQHNGCPPIVSKKGGLKGGEVILNSRQSSQYLSSLLMCAPYAKQDVLITIKGAIASIPYIDMTIRVMNDFGIAVENKEYSKFIVRAGQRYSCRDYTIEADVSGASYFFAAAAITGGRIKVVNMPHDTLQGDIRFLDLLQKMGCQVETGTEYIAVKGGELRGINVDMNAMPDMVQTLAVVSLFAEGKTRISNVPNLRIKETDRLSALSRELKKIGASVEEYKDGLVISPQKLRPAEIETYNDHRMAMSFAIAGLKIKGIRIKNPECVSKSFPGFFEKLKELG